MSVLSCGLRYTFLLLEIDSSREFGFLTVSSQLLVLLLRSVRWKILYVSCFTVFLCGRFHITFRTWFSVFSFRDVDSLNIREKIRDLFPFMEDVHTVL